MGVPDHHGFFGLGRSFFVFDGIDGDVAEIFFLEGEFFLRGESSVVDASAFFGDLALAFGGLVFGDDVGGEADDRSGGGADGDGLASSGTGGAGDGACKDAGAASEDGGIFSWGDIGAACGEDGDGGSDGDLGKGFIFHREFLGEE